MTRRKPVILVVDDESDIRSSLRMILEYEGMQVEEAGSGEEALEAIGRVRPEAVLLDIKMPRVDGLEVLAEARRRDPDLPIIVISGHATIATAVEATRLGAFDFMEKPLERDRVLVRIRNANGRIEVIGEDRDDVLVEAAKRARAESQDEAQRLLDAIRIAHQETAESLGLEPNTVKTRLHRARTLLRERLVHDFDAAALQAFPFGAERCDRLVAGVLDRLAGRAR